VTEALRAHRVPPRRLVLEVSEHAVAQEPALTGRLAALRAVGVRVALDDVGVGYSALGRLGGVPVDLLKIGAPIVAQPPTGPGRPAGPLVEVLARLGDRLDIDVVASGVAGPAQLSVVRAAGCRYAQGDRCGAPVPAEHFEAALHAGHRLPRPRLEQPTERV
jgi:EAL domain-containing protein (putative c-di-GMP-specific phosphodiesterase class I)